MCSIYMPSTSFRYVIWRTMNWLNSLQMLLSVHIARLKNLNRTQTLNHQAKDRCVFRVRCPSEKLNSFHCDTICSAIFLSLWQTSETLGFQSVRQISHRFDCPGLQTLTVANWPQTNRNSILLVGFLFLLATLASKQIKID